MSLGRFALRRCAFHALTGATLVGTNVRDSDIGAIDIVGEGGVRTDEDAPFVLIYTDDGNADTPGLRDLRQNGTVDFVAEFGIASAMTDTDPETGAPTIVGFNVPATDAAFEMALDLIDRQIVAALAGPGPWADLWRRLSDSVVRLERRRAASSDNGVRVAARQLRIRLSAWADPVYGQPLVAGSIWADVVAAITAADPDLAGITAAFLGPVADEVTLSVLRASRGHTVGEARSLGYGPLYPQGEGYVIETAEVVGERRA